jgi:signal transduction histidine kinase
MRRPGSLWDSRRVADPPAGWSILAAATALVAVSLLAVALVRARGAAARVLQERSWLLERERESAAQNAIEAERARIARELHDIVSHNVSVMVVQAGAARQVLASSPGDAAEALLAVEAAGRGTLTELRHLLGVLAPPDDGAEEADLSPQPSLRRLSPLIDRIAFAGLPVEVRISGEPRPLPSGVDLTAYRIIQEALTNALKHAGSAKAEVTVRYAEHYLRIEVVNSGPSVVFTQAPAHAVQRARAGPGRGLLGLHQRVAVYGGHLDARRRLGGGYRVRARIPLERP